jgi:ketosteroid isomerase-like protein
LKVSASLPKPIRAFVDATNAGDTDAFLAAFASDATLDDWGRAFSGRQGIASWNETDNIGKHAHFDPVDCNPGPEPDTFVVTLTVSGGGFNGTGPMTFTVRDDHIERVVISPT